MSRIAGTGTIGLKTTTGDLGVVSQEISRDRVCGFYAYSAKLLLFACS